MPKMTFFNLADEKREIFLKAAVEEFSTHSYHDANVREIVRKANISIGSFYCYFDSKTELFVYISDYMFQKFLEQQEALGKQLNRDVKTEEILEMEPLQKAFWEQFEKCSLDKRKHYYLRTNNNQLFERFLGEVEEYGTKTEYTEREKRMVAFVMNSLQYILDEFAEADGTDRVVDEELLLLKKMLKTGYQNLER